MESRKRNSGCFCLLVVVVLFGLFSSSLLFADMGAIYTHRDNVTVSEPAQKAVILHNGSEEILILETDIKASAQTEIMRFIPFPSEPKVSLAPENAIGEMGKLVQAKNLQYISIYHTKGGSGANSHPVAEVVSRTKLGAHDITVVRINDAAHFSKWVKDCFKNKKGLQTGPELAQVAKTAAEYTKDGIPYFVFDFVMIGNDDKSVAPVAFRFESKKVYYPLRTSNTIGGEGRIQLFFLAIDYVEQPLNSDFHPFFVSDSQLVRFDYSTIAEVKPEEANTVYPDAAAFFGEMPIVLQAAEYTGPLQFTKDLNVFMITHYDRSLYQAGGTAQGQPVGPDGFAPSLKYRLSGRLDPFSNAENINVRRKLLMEQMVNCSVQLKSVGRKVQFRDGMSIDKGAPVEISRIALGELNRDVVSSTAFVTRTKDKRQVCELTLFNIVKDKAGEKPRLERAGSVLLSSRDIQGFSVVDGSVRIARLGGTTDIYRFQNGELKLSQ